MASPSTKTAATTANTDAPSHHRTYVLFGRGIIVIGILLILVVMPICIWELKANAHAENHIVAWFVGGVFAVAATCISLGDIANHLMHYGAPELQRYIIRIMWMVPIYAIESWLSLRFKTYALYIETARECYEAYVVYCFTYLMIYFCAHGDEDRYGEELATKDPHKGAQLPPFSWCFKPWKLGRSFLDRCKMGVLQYVVVRIFCTLVTFITHFTGHYCNGAMTDFSCAYVWMLLIVNASQMWAMYCLVMFYHATNDELKQIRPFPKFICVKAVVFFSFWQAVVIAGLVKGGVIKATLTYNVSEIADGLQDFLICIEMFIAAIAHHFYYPWHDVVDENSKPKMNFLKAFVASAMPTDVAKDVAGAVKRVATPHAHADVETPMVTATNPLHVGHK